MAEGTTRSDQHSDLEQEQRYLDVLYAHLDGMRTYASKRLKDVLLQTGGTPQARSERESFTQLYTEDLSKYDAAEHGLCFGRIDLDDEDEPRYVGRIGILDEANDYETLLLDWRAPLARPFYLATTATPEGVTRRRHIRSRSRKVTAVNDEYLDLDAAEAAGQLDSGAGGVGGESALLSALNAARTGHMNEIVETIQSEQDAIIRSDHKSVLVVQGGPGTGKTAVALHRAAYLLYTYRQQLAKSGVLIIGPNTTFLEYISQVLPSLGETGVLLSTIGELYPGVKPVRADSERAAELKGSLAIIDVLKNAVRDRQELPGKPMTFNFDGFPVVLDRQIVTRARGRARSSRRPHNLARPIFMSMVFDQLADQVVAAMGKNVTGGSNLLSRDDVQDIRADLRSDDPIRTAVAALWPELSPPDVLSALWSSPQRLGYAARHLSEADRRELQSKGGFSAADAPLLDELAELLGYDDTAERERARTRWRAQIADAQDALDILTGSAPQDLEDELDPEILMAYDLIDAEQLAFRHENRARGTTAERAAGDRTWTYGHVIVDEAQELSEMAWRMVMRRIPNRWVTAVGDVAQTSEAAGTTSWQTVLEPYVAKRWKLAELTVNYRTPAEIMNVAAGVLAEIDPDAEVPTSVRESGIEPVAIKSGDIVGSVAEVIQNDSTPGILAVLTTSEHVAQLAHLADERVSVLTVKDAKGLEFDSVVIVEPREILRDARRGLNDLYVALTRATQRLTVIHSGDLPDVLTGLRQTV